MLLFTPKCELHWTIKQGQYTIPIRDSLIDMNHCQVFSKLYILHNKKARKRISFKQKEKDASAVQLHIFRSKKALASDFENNNNINAVTP